jgi:hypothetical protein
LSRILRISYSSRTSWSTSRQALTVASLAQTPASPGISPKHVPSPRVLNRALFIASLMYRVNISPMIAGGWRDRLTGMARDPAFETSDST